MLMCIKIALFPIINQNLHAETNDSLASPLHWWFTCGVCGFKQQNITFLLHAHRSDLELSATSGSFLNFFSSRWNFSLPQKKREIVSFVWVDRFLSKCNQSNSSVWGQGRLTLADTTKGNNTEYFMIRLFCFSGGKNLEKVSRCLNNWEAARVGGDLESPHTCFDSSSSILATKKWFKKQKTERSNQPRSATDNMAHQHDMPWTTRWTPTT